MVTEVGRQPWVVYEYLRTKDAVTDMTGLWWSFAAAFAFMVTLVLAANLFADGVRDAFDPRPGSRR